MAAGSSVAAKLGELQQVVSSQAATISALEQAIEQWPHSREPIELVYWPKAPIGESGITLYVGRLKNLVGSLDNLKISAVCSAIPRPNQAFWTLSALWAGWLWGPETLGDFISVLRRRRYEWSWHTGALQNTLSHLAAYLKGTD